MGPIILRRSAMSIGFAMMPLITPVAASAWPRLNFAASPDAKLVAKSTWKGEWSQDARKANGKGKTAALIIQSRDGDHLIALFKVGAGKKPKTIRLEGTVDDDGNLVLKPTAIESGDWGNHALDQIYVGHVDDTQLSFMIQNGKNGDPNAQAQEVSLTLAGGNE